MKDEIKAQLDNEYIRLTGKEVESLWKEGKVKFKRKSPRFLKLGDLIEYGEVNLRYSAGSSFYNTYSPWETILEFDLVKK